MTISTKMVYEKGEVKQVNYNSGTTSMVYSALGRDKDEIRLITLQKPPNGSMLVHCSLETVSLQDVRDDYAAHLVSPDVAGKTRRKAVSLWAGRRIRRPGRSATGVNSVDSHVPSPRDYRFHWGDYAALSYVWGSEISRRNIVVNGRETSVTENLEIVLRVLSRRYHFGGHYKLWVDALCINQRDEDEKAFQISKMREIYSGAWAVIAWLGDEYDDSDKALDLLQQFAKMNEERQKELAGQIARRPDSLGKRSFFGLNELMKRQYWSRLWIVQELVLGGSASVLRCGDRALDWSTFCAGIDVLFRADMWIIKDRLLQSEDSVWDTLSLHLVHKDIRVLSQYEEEGGGRLGFRRLLDIACSSDCWDARDKVFALFGMIDPSIVKKLAHDYSMNIVHLFAAVSQAFITHFNNLEPLREGNPWSQTGTPSWAADWSWDGRLRYSRPETPIWGTWQKIDGPEPSQEQVYHATDGRPARFGFPEDGLLACDGFVFDSIAGLGARGWEYFRWEKSTMVQCPIWQSAYGGKDETATAIYQTLLLGRVSGCGMAGKRHSAILNLPCTFNRALPQFESRGWTWMASQEQYYFRWEEWRQANDTLQLGHRMLGEYFSDVIPNDAEERDFDEVYGVFDRTCKERRLMLTAGGYIGWAPDNIYGTDEDQTRPGDLICIIFGCSTPLVIRPFDNYFQVVGEAYVQGFMDGEAMKFVDSGDCQIKTFTFC